MNQRALALAALLAAFNAQAAEVEPAQPFAHPATAEELRASLLGTALAQIEGAKVLEGRFVQQRRLRGLTKPLESRGEFLLVRDLGIDWRTLEPVESELVITRAGLFVRNGDGAQARQPQLRVATELLFALFSLDLAALERRFVLSGVGSPASWQIGLRAREASTARAVRQAIIRGGTLVEAITLENGAGDAMHIELHEVSTRAAGLSDAERARFQ